MIAFFIGGVSVVADTRPAAAQVVKYDGTYVGLQTLTEDSAGNQNYSKCLKGPFKRRLVVKDGAVTYTYNPTYQGTVTGSVSADGDVTASASPPSGGVSLSGKIEGDDFTGKILSVICTYSLRLRRVS